MIAPPAPRWNKNKPVIPFGSDGNMIDRVPKWRTDVTWVEQPPVVHQLMKFVSFYYDSPRVIIEDQAGVKWWSFDDDIEYLLENHTITKGWFPPMDWTFIKRGESYGIALKDRLANV